MAWDEALIARADWSARPPELGALREQDGGEVAMELRWPGRVDDWASLCARWIKLPPHPHLLRPMAYTNERAWLRYAAIDWTRASTPSTRVEVATCGVRLTRVFELIDHTLEQREHAWLARPVVYFDLLGAPRVGFAPSRGHRDALPPEVVTQWPFCGQRGYVFAIGQVLSELDHGVLGLIVERCLRTDRLRRFASLVELRVALVLAGGLDDDDDDRGPAWDAIEAGVGCLELGKLPAARARFAAAASDARWAPLAQAGLRVVARALDPPVISEAERTAAASHAEAARAAAQRALDAARRLEAARDFVRARDLYRGLPPSHAAAQHAGLARCFLALGDVGPAQDHARRALAEDADAPDALGTAIDVALAVHRPHDAMAWADALIAATPDDGVAHYKRGRCQIALGQHADARASFDRACALRPELLEAMYLRREADRMQRAVRDTVGEQPALGLDVPPHLAHVRDALLAGRVIDALAILARPVHHDDPLAQLLRAAILADQQRLTEALVIYERPGGLFDDHREPVLLGKARVLAALDDPEAALRLLDRACAEDPGSRAAAEARAAVLIQLGRGAEAEADLRRAANAGAAR